VTRSAQETCLRERTAERRIFAVSPPRGLILIARPAACSGGFCMTETFFTIPRRCPLRRSLLQLHVTPSCPASRLRLNHRSPLGFFRYLPARPAPRVRTSFRAFSPHPSVPVGPGDVVCGFSRGRPIPSAFSGEGKGGESPGFLSVEKIRTVYYLARRESVWWGEYKGKEGRVDE